MADDLFTSVMAHAEKYSHVTSPEGAFAFNQMFEDPVRGFHSAFFVDECLSLTEIGANYL